MWLFIFASKSAKELFSLIMSNAFNGFIAVTGIWFGIKGILEGEIVFGIISLSVGLLVGGITLYIIYRFVQRGLLKMEMEKRNKETHKDR